MAFFKVFLIVKQILNVLLTVNAVPSVIVSFYSLNKIPDVDIYH